ncbi:calcium/proton antiporter [Sphingobacterium sp. ML3W]|uniref:calcium:proton antiporter n=1 Tax=Sphingobacterium sp. ML3W TaxID=1538644 RepID=UPI0004F92A17|nr:calcium:proton antiporter [Sphingobacterium sp. ML3W]AIM38234.1 calcium/proton antiporter [Sphingobacterium sp. ML3W]
MKTIVTTKTIVRLLIIWIVVIGLMLFENQLFKTTLSSTTAVVLFMVLLTTILTASFGVVKEADELAHKLGEPFGTLILTLSIVAIEVVLIAAVMLGPAESPTIGKDSIFSVMMIIMNLVVGLCILLGSSKHQEQEYNAQGTLTYFSMIVILGGTSLLLPNFIKGSGDGSFTTVQALFISTIIILVYVAFLRYQLKGYHHLYIQPMAGTLEIKYPKQKLNSQLDQDHTNLDNKKQIWIRSILLLLMILPIVLLSHQMAIVVDYGIETIQLPLALGGILIAIIVFTPESITAVKAAINNEFQRSINLCHGAFVSTVGLTVPAVLLVGLLKGKLVLFGLSDTETVLFVMTLLLSLISFLGKRTTPILGVIHLALFAIYMLLVFNP